MNKSSEKNKLYLFTIVIDFRGSTIVEQVLAKNQFNAYVLCLEKVSPFLKGVGKKTISNLIDDFNASSEEEIVKVKGMKNVWCQTNILRGHLAIFNIIKTDRV